MKYYAVANGRDVGVYRTWEECEKLVKGYSGAIHKSFESEEDAVKYIADHSLNRKKRSIRPGKRSAEESSKDQTTKQQKALEEKRVKVKSVKEGYREDCARSIDRPPGVIFKGERTDQPPSSAVYLYSDGACQHERCGIGFLIKDSQERTLYTHYAYLRELRTNNQAEYMALILGLEECSQRGHSAVIARVDSKLIVGQIMHDWNINCDKLRKYQERAKRLTRAFGYFRMQHVFREYNEEADALSKQALGIPVNAVQECQIVAK